MSQLLQSIKDRQVLPLIQPRDLIALKVPTGNIYESIVIMAKRANRLNEQLSLEIQPEIEAFSSQTDTFEEVQENQEQIELSRMYERLPNPALVALDEFAKGELIFGDSEEVRVQLRENEEQTKGQEQ